MFPAGRRLEDQRRPGRAGERGVRCVALKPDGVKPASVRPVWPGVIPCATATLAVTVISPATGELLTQVVAPAAAGRLLRPDAWDRRRRDRRRRIAAEAGVGETIVPL